MPRSRPTATSDAVASRPGRPRRARSRPAPAVLVGAAVLGLAGCSASAEVSTKKTIDVDEMQAAIVKQYAEQQVTLTKLDCEDDVEAKTGAPITCRGVNSKGTILNIRGTVTVAGDGGGRFRVRTVSALARGSIIAAKARAELEKKFDQRARSLTCPETIPIPTTPSVTCELTALDGSKVDVELTLDDQAFIKIEVADELKSGPTG